MRLSFAKMNGAGNDFVVLDNRSGQWQLPQALIARLCDRHRGVGSDGLLAVEPAQNGADFRMRYYNSDGGEAEMCGNGARCFARYAARLTGHTDAVSFETAAGVIKGELLGDRVRLAMSVPQNLQLGASLALEPGATPLQVHSINTGVPHAVVAVDNIANIDVQTLGSALRWHSHFAPKGTNANFMQKMPDGTIVIRTYERGVEGETLACGTGVVAAALIHHRLTGAASPVHVRVQGGDVLEVGFEEAEGGGFRNVTLTGPADFVFEGEIAL